MNRKLFYLWAIIFMIVPLAVFSYTATNFNVSYKDEIVDPATFYCYFVQPDSQSVYFYLQDYFDVDDKGKLHTGSQHQRAPLHLDSLVVPSAVTINGKEYTVVGIANACFANTSLVDIKKVILPKTVKYIDYYGFIENDSIREIHGEGVTHVGEMAFYRNSSLKVVDLPNLKYAGQRVFGCCYSLETISLPNFIGPFEGTDNYHFFQTCTKLREVNCPKLESLTEAEFLGDTCIKRFSFPHVKKIYDKFHGGAGLFYGCTQEVECVYLPELTSPVEIGTFSRDEYDSPKIDSLIIPKVKTFHPYQINGFKYLDIRSVVVDSIIRYSPGTLFDNVIDHIVCHDSGILHWLNYMYIANMNNYNNYHYKSPNRPNTYNECNDYPGFETVELTNETEMVDTAFMHIPNIKHLVLHKGSTSYNPRALYTLKNLEDITVKSNSETFSDDRGVLFDKSGKTLLYYPLCNETSKDSLGNDRQWIFPEHEINGVGEYALYHYVGVDPRSNDGTHHQLHISRGETCTIGEHALDGSSVDRVTFDLDAPLATVSPYAFANMTEPCFRYLKMPKALTTIESNAFSGDTQLQALEVFGTNLLTVGDNAFAGQTSITSIALPNTVTTIGENAFKGNTSMQYITLPTSLNTIGKDALSGCLSTMVVKIPSATITGEDLAQCFESTDTKPSLLMPKALQANFSGWTFDEPTKTVTVKPARYLSFTRSYPVSIDITKAPNTHFYRATGTSEKQTSGDYKGKYLITLKHLTAKDLKLLPANSPILMWNLNDKDESFTYTICDNADGVVAPESVVKAAAGAVRLDQHETIDGDDYTNFILYSGADEPGKYRLVAQRPWTEVATRRGEQSYLHLKGDYSDTEAKQFVFVVDDSTVTGIDSINADADAHDDAWYTLSGVRTSRPQHGVYIHNGRKVIVK